jgi:tetratricopeptide (TPR) repeat protein
VSTPAHNRMPVAWPCLFCLLTALAGGGCGVASQGMNVEGTRLYQQGQYQGALERFQQAIANDPKNADGYYNVASTYHRLGKLNRDQKLLAQAEIFYNQALDKYDDQHLTKNPSQTDCYRGLAVLLAETNRPDATVRLLERWVAQNPTSADAKIELARAMDELGNRQVAEQRLLEALASEPNNTRALTALAKLREDQGNPIQAMQIYQRSLDINRFQPQVAARLTTLQTSLGQLPSTSTPTTSRVATEPIQWNRY